MLINGEFISRTQRLMLPQGLNINRGKFFWLHNTKPAIHISLETWLHLMLFLFSNKGSFLKTSCSLNNGHFWMFFFDGLRLSRLLVLLGTRLSPEGLCSGCSAGNCSRLNPSFSFEIFRNRIYCSSHHFSY